MNRAPSPKLNFSSERAWTQELRRFSELLRVGGEGVQPLKQYQQDPIAFFVDVLGMREEMLRWSMLPFYKGHKWDGTPDPLAAILEALARGEDVGAESGTGTGKTVLAAGIGLWFLASFERALVVTAAPKEKQLKLHLWKELTRFWIYFANVFPLAQRFGLQVRMIPHSDDWTMVGFSSGVGADEDAATKAQGFHAEHMLILTEETPGIHPAIMTAFENTRTAPHNIHCGLGNPDHQQDALHTYCILDTTTHVRISALDHPNVVADDPLIIPGAVSKPMVVKRRERYGEGGRLYQTRVRGMCPAESSEAVIRYSWCADARLKGEDPLTRREYIDGPAALGVDVANSKEGDKGCIARGQGRVLLVADAFPCPDPTVLGITVAAEIRARGIDEKHVGVDSVGVGAATFGRVKEAGFLIQGLNGAESPVVVEGEEEFANLRAQMHWQLRMDLQHGLLILPDDDELFEDLTVAQWKVRQGKIYVESKEDIKKRLGRSPDKGDAVVYWNWVRELRGATSGLAEAVDF